MTPEEWIRIVRVVNAKLGGWSPDRAAAYGVELQHYKAIDVAKAILRVHKAGRELTGTEIKTDIEAVKGRWSKKIIDRHRELFPRGCPYQCDICRPVLDVETRAV